MSDQGQGGPGSQDLPSVDRLLGLSDGVVAIAITLIVLQVQVPAHLADPNSPSELAHALGQLSTAIVAYLVSFYVIAQFWLAHHRVFRLVRGHHEGLAWINFLFLLTITAMPFTSDLIGTYGSNPVAIDIFNVNLLVASISTSLVVAFGRWRHLMVPGDLRSQIVPGLQRSAGLAAVVIASAIVAWWSTSIAKNLWFLLIVVGFVAGRSYKQKEEAGGPAAGASAPVGPGA
jgi:uncharacterized membrane protein